MRDCAELSELLSASLDGCLTTDEQAALDAHLAQCPACSALFAQLHALHIAATELEEIPAPAGFTDKVMAAVAADVNAKPTDNVIPLTPRLSGRARRSRWAVTAAAVVIVALGALSLPALGNNFSMKSSAPTNGAPQMALADMSQAESEDDFSPAEPQAPPAAGASPAFNQAMDDGGLGQARTEGACSQVAFDCSELDLVGTLILSSGQLPDTLEQYECFDRDGTPAYLIPANEFSLLVQALDEQTLATCYTAGRPDAEQGMVVVQDAP